jgi:hypothetical protein
MLNAVLLVAAALGLGQQSPIDAPAAIVSGRVVDATTGRPIAGAVVIPFGSATQGVQEETTPGPLPRALTNAGGHFVIRGLRQGSLILLAVKGGYVDAAFGQTRPGGHGQAIPIATGGCTNDLEIRMWRGAAITGTVTDEAGEPVIGVRVQAFAGSYVAGRRRFTAVGSAATDDRGAYRIPHLLPGDYIVAVPSKQTAIPTEVTDVFFAGGSTRAERDELGREMQTIDAPVVPAGSHYATSLGSMTIPLAPGTATPTSRADGRLMVYPTTFFPAAPSAAQAGVVSLIAGQEYSNADVSMRLTRSANVSGALVGPPGMTSHVAVRLTATGNDALGDEMNTAATITDNTGAFTFTGVPQGEYTLSVVRVPRPPVEADSANRMTVQTGTVAISPRAAPASGSEPPSPVPADATLWARMPLAVGDDDVTNVIVPLRAGLRMSGRIVFEGTTEQPDRSAIARVAILLQNADGSPSIRALAREAGHADEDGTFRTVGVPPGRYVVGITGPPLGGGWVFKGATYQGRDIADTPVEMNADDVPGVILSFTDRPAALEGTVTTRGAPDGDVLVLAYPVQQDAWSTSGPSPRRMRAVRPGKDGAYVIPNLPPGEYFVVAIKEDVTDWQEPLLRALARSADQVRVLDGGRTVANLRTVAIR